LITLYYQTDIRIPNSIPYHLRSTEEYNFKSVKPTFISEYSSYLKIPIRKVTKETYKGEKAFYHIEIDWIDQATIWQNVFTWIDNDVLQLLQNTSSKLNLLLWFPNEGFPLSFPRFIDIIDYCLKELKIPDKKVFFVFGDLNIQENYGKYIKNGLNKINVYGLNSFEATYHNECRLLEKDGHGAIFVNNEHRRKNLHQTKNKRFIFKNANPRDHRIYFAAELKRRGLLELSYYSWLNRYNNPNKDSCKDIIRKYSYNNKFNNKIIRHAEEFLANAPYILDYDKDSIGEGLNQRMLISKHFTDSYFSFVTETTYDNTEQNVLFVTEKIYQPMVQYHPFIVAACPGFLRYLRSCGYETFPELFDESYDKEQNLKLRTKLIIDNIQNVVNMPEKKLHDIYYSDYFQDKLIHNRNLFFSLNGKKQWLETFAWLDRNAR